MLVPPMPSCEKAHLLSSGICKGLLLLAVATILSPKTAQAQACRVLLVESFLSEHLHTFGRHRMLSWHTIIRSQLTFSDQTAFS